MENNCITVNYRKRYLILTKHLRKLAKETKMNQYEMALALITNLVNLLRLNQNFIAEKELTSEFVKYCSNINLTDGIYVWFEGIIELFKELDLQLPIFGE